jgi:hypothetical protein
MRRTAHSQVDFFRAGFAQVTRLRMTVMWLPNLWNLRNLRITFSQ